MAFACRNVGANSILVARIEYEKSVVPESDLTIIRQMLDDIGNATEARVASLPGPPAPATRGAAPQTFIDGPQILSPNPQGYDFAAYLIMVTRRIRQNWFAVMPATATQGEWGRVDIRFTITREGTITDLQIIGSANPALDQAATTAIQTSNPLPALPAEFKGDRLTLRLPFLYNLPSVQRD